jgi:site-specific DNA-methyltransferase (adenine-specific)
LPVHIADNLTKEQVQAYRIADNKTGELAEWDNNGLPQIYTNLYNYTKN